jgi:hypothetical protein
MIGKFAKSFQRLVGMKSKTLKIIYYIILRLGIGVQLAKKERTYELIINFLILYENLMNYKLKVNFKKTFNH